jgi:hypothetical protein
MPTPQTRTSPNSKKLSHPRLHSSMATSVQSFSMSKRQTTIKNTLQRSFTDFFGNGWANSSIRSWKETTLLASLRLSISRRCSTHPVIAMKAIPSLHYAITLLPNASSHSSQVLYSLRPLTKYSPRKTCLPTWSRNLFLPQHQSARLSA